MTQKQVPDRDKTREQLVEELEEMREKVARLNALAGAGTVHNSAYFRERLDEEVSRSTRYKYNFSIGVLEADNFDAYNKKFGSAAGNEIMAMLQTILRNALRTSDLFCHFENSKFGFLLPYTDNWGTAIISDRIRQTTERVLALKSMSAGISLTISMGLACFPQDAISAKMLVDQAEIALARARGKGGNACSFASTEEKPAQPAGPLPPYSRNEALLTLLDDEIQRSSRFGTEMSLMLLTFSVRNEDGSYTPISEKKSVMEMTDRYVSCCVRGMDKQFPYDNNRVAVLLPNTNAAGAQILAGKMLKAAAASQAADAGVLLSIGISSFPLDEISREGIIRTSESALQSAIRKGGNQVMLATSLRNKDGNARDISSWIEGLRESGQNGIYNLLAVVDATEHYIIPHSQNTSKLAMAMGQAMSLHTAGIRKLRVIALLHDVGKIYLKAETLTRPGPLQEDEWTLMQKHPEFGASIVQQFTDYAFCAKAIRAHHERIDGGGYPAGLAGDQIPLESRIIAVAEAYDDMVTPRPYREHLSIGQAMKEIARCSGTQFSPAVVNALKAVVLNPPAR